MKEYQFKVGLRKGFDTVNLQLQEGIKFFYDEKFSGDFRAFNCNHYTTVIPLTEFMEWQEYLKSTHTIHIHKQEIGNYLVVSIDNIENGNDLPIVEREEWFREHAIDFSNIAVYTKDTNGRGMYVVRIMEFRNIDDIDYKIATRRDFFSQGPYYSMSVNKGKFSTIYHWINSHDTSEIFVGKRAEEYWNNMVHVVLVNMNELAFNTPTTIDFDEEFITLAKRYLKEEIA